MLSTHEDDSSPTRGVVFGRNMEERDDVFERRNSHVFDSELNEGDLLLEN